MGLWQTGYMEFHEPSGLDGFYWDRSPSVFPCAHCNEIFSSTDELREHRFESHPLRQPVLFLQGRELGVHPARITKGLAVEDVTVHGCDRAMLNGKGIGIGLLPKKLAQIRSDVCHVTLSKADISCEFTLDFRIASEADLRGIEEQFEQTARGRRLDVRAVEEFISATSGFVSAIGYCDGICAYLYGILAKERAPDSSLPYDKYAGKFSKAAEGLGAYDRPLADVIGGLVEFHFNHFHEAARLARDVRVGQAAERFATWLQGWVPRLDQKTFPAKIPVMIDSLVTDWETEQIVRWAIQPLHELLQHADDMHAFLRRDLAEYDRVKVNVLLGECFAASGDIRSVLQIARSMRNLSGPEKWAESLIRTHAEVDDE